MGQENFLGRAYFLGSVGNEQILNLGLQAAVITRPFKILLCGLNIFTLCLADRYIAPYF